MCLIGIQTKAVPSLCVSFVSAVEELNHVVSEAFLHFFVRTVGHYASYVKPSHAGEQGVFEKRNFYKAIESKTTRHFVKKFIQTQMFDLFIQEVEQQHPGPQQGQHWDHTHKTLVVRKLQLSNLYFTVHLIKVYNLGG